MRRARICYDHLAGEIAVALTDAMVTRGQIEIGPDGAALTDKGRALLAEIGVELPSEEKGAVFCRPCLDWSERRHHLAGAVGAALYRTFLARGWIRRSAEGRTVTVTPPGRTALERYFGVSG
jgi:ribosomal protein S19E (S16A)